MILRSQANLCTCRSQLSNYWTERSSGKEMFSLIRWCRNL